MALALFGRHEDHVAHELRPRPDDGHVALEDVEEFGELVEAGAAQEPAVGGQAHVVGEQFPAGVALVCHGAELDEPEDFLVQPGARLRKEGVPLHLDCAKEGERDQQRAQAHDGESGAAEVQGSFYVLCIHYATSLDPAPSNLTLLRQQVAKYRISTTNLAVLRSG